MNADPGRCYTRTELRDILKISPNTLRRMDREGTGPRPIRLSPRIVRYPAAEVAEFLEAAGLDAPAEVRAACDGEPTHAIA